MEAHGESSENLSSSVLKLPALSSNWIKLQGDNSYCYCACSSPANNKQKHDSNMPMNVKEGAPYLYAVLTKDDDSIDFPTGAVMTIEGPDGTKYDRDIQEENQLVIMSGSSVRCLIVKDPMPGDWKMTMSAPEGVGFHCECNTVPSKDPYKTITTTLSKTNQLQKRGSSNHVSPGWVGVAITGLACAAGGALLAPALAAGAIATGLIGFAVGGIGAAAYMLFSREQDEPVKVVNVANNLHSLAKINSTGGATGEILLIDPAVEDDQATRIAYKQRKRKLFPIIDKSKYGDKKTSLVGEEVTRSNVQTILKKTSVIYCTASGHGLPDVLHGLRDKEGVWQEIIGKRHYDPAEVQGKIFHFFACSCGYRSDTMDGLGADLLKNGAKAFIGYSDRFRMVVRSQIEFYSCDMEIDLALLEGETVGTAYDRAIKKFNKEIDWFRDENNLETRDPLAAEDLEFNRDILGFYGDENAKLF